MWKRWTLISTTQCYLGISAMWIPTEAAFGLGLRIRLPKSGGRADGNWSPRWLVYVPQPGGDGRPKARVKCARGRLPREGIGTDQDLVTVFGFWKRPGTSFSLVGMCCLQRILTSNRKCPSHSHLFLGVLKALLSFCLGCLMGRHSSESLAVHGLAEEGLTSMLSSPSSC